MSKEGEEKNANSSGIGQNSVKYFFSHFIAWDKIIGLYFNWIPFYMDVKASKQLNTLKFSSSKSYKKQLILR